MLLPSPKSERWKYTNLDRAIKGLTLAPASLGWGGNVALLNPHAPGALVYGDTQLWDLNAVNTKDLKFISSDETIHIHAQDGQSLSPRIIIDVKDGQSITVIEQYDGIGAYWKNAVVQINIGKNAKLRHYRTINEGEQGVCTIFTHAKIAEGATYESFNFIHGAGFIRNQIHTEIIGANADCGLGGVNLLSGAQHADTTITIEHQAPHCTSNQTYKSVLDGQSHGVFQGKVHVHQIAQKTDGYQLSNALMLSPLAEMNTKPELEIYADDVKCSHGATTGKLDDEPMFYMQSRGISEPQAKALLIEAFCMAAVDTITDADYADNIKGKINQWLMSRT